MEIKLKTDDLVTVAHAAESLGCTTMTIYRWLKSGKIIGAEVDGSQFILRTEVERLQKEGAAADATAALPGSRGQDKTPTKRR